MFFFFFRNYFCDSIRIERRKKGEKRSAFYRRSSPCIFYALFRSGNPRAFSRRIRRFDFHRLNRSIQRIANLLFHNSRSDFRHLILMTAYAGQLGPKMLTIIHIVEAYDGHVLRYSDPQLTHSLYRPESDVVVLRNEGGRHVVSQPCQPLDGVISAFQMSAFMIDHDMFVAQLQTAAGDLLLNQAQSGLEKTISDKSKPSMPQ